MWQTATKKFIVKVFIFWLKSLRPVCFQPKRMLEIFGIWPLLEPFVSWSIVFITFYLKVFLTRFTWRKLAGKICGLAGLWRPHLHYSVKSPQAPDTNFLSYPHHLNFGSCYTEEKTWGCLAPKHYSHLSSGIINQNIHYLCNMVREEQWKVMEKKIKDIYAQDKVETSAFIRQRGKLLRVEIKILQAVLRK